MDEDVKAFLRAKRNYLEAKAAFESVRERASNVNRRLDDLLEAGLITVDEWAERTTDVEFQLGWDEAFQRLVEAEEALVEAGKRLLEKRLAAEEAERIKAVWECKFASIREKVVDVLLKWDPTS